MLVKDIPCVTPEWRAALLPWFTRSLMSRAVSTILRQPGSAIYCSSSMVHVSAVD